MNLVNIWGNFYLFFPCGFSFRGPKTSEETPTESSQIRLNDRLLLTFYNIEAEQNNFSSIEM